jgi:hypothetical protein
LLVSWDFVAETLREPLAMPGTPASTDTVTELEKPQLLVQLPYWV